MYHLAWNQFRCQMHGSNMCYMPTWSPTEATTATSPNTSPKAPILTLWCSLFYFDGSEYLVITDYCSKMPVFVDCLHPNVVLQRQYLSWRNYLQNMGFQCLYILTMNHNLQMHCLLSLPQSDNQITSEVHPGIPEVMAKQKLLWRSWKKLLLMLSVQARIHT